MVRSGRHRPDHPEKPSAFRGPRSWGGRPGPAARRLLEVARENWKLKVLATLFAILLWLFVVGERLGEIGLVVPIELRNIPPGTVVAGEVERAVHVRLAGPQTLLTGVSPDQVRVVLDLSQAQPDRPEVIVFSPTLVSAPRGLEVVRFIPPSITIRLTRLTRRWVPVEVIVTGRPEGGLKVEGWRSDPPQVEVVGGAEEVETVSAVETEPIDLSAAAGDVVREVPLRTPPGGVRIEGPAAVRVLVRLGRSGP